MLKPANSGEFYRCPWGNKWDWISANMCAEPRKAVREGTNVKEKQITVTEHVTKNRHSHSRMFHFKNTRNEEVPIYTVKRSKDLDMPDITWICLRRAARIRSFVIRSFKTKRQSKAPSHAIESMKLTCMESGMILRDMMMSNPYVGWSDVFWFPVGKAWCGFVHSEKPWNI